jgi:hypothetical protein
VKRKKQPTGVDQLADYAVRLLEIAAELRAWGIRTELLKVMNVLRTVQERLMDRVYETRP